jgi:hypothetical protein
VGKIYNRKYNVDGVPACLLAQIFNPLTPELNPSAQRCLPRFFAGDFNF